VEDLPPTSLPSPGSSYVYIGLSHRDIHNIEQVDVLLPPPLPSPGSGYVYIGLSHRDIHNIEQVEVLLLPPPHRALVTST
jgi:hypothetical protein